MWWFIIIHSFQVGMHTIVVIEDAYETPYQFALPGTPKKMHVRHRQDLLRILLTNHVLVQVVHQLGVQ